MKISLLPAEKCSIPSALLQDGEKFVNGKHACFDRQANFHTSHTPANCYSLVRGKEEEKWKWSLQFCFFDPTLSEGLGPMPEPRRRLVGATRYQIFLSVAPAVDWIQSAGPNFLVRRTKLLTPSDDHLPVFKVA